MNTMARGMIGLGLAGGLVGGAAGCASLPAEDTRAVAKVTVSQDGYEATIGRLDAAVAARPLKVFAVIDHAGGAAGIGADLAPSRLLIFGNPEAGTPFMQANPAFGHELPLRVLVYVEAGETKIAWPDIAALSQAYGVSPDAAPVAQVAGTLEAIIAEAAGN